MSTTGQPQEQNHCYSARRHMTPREFIIYDAMVAMVKSDPDWRPGKLIFYGRRITLANATDLSLKSIDSALKGLAEKHWVFKPDSEQERFDNGRWGAIHYKVIEHEEYAARYNCPPLRYDQEGRSSRSGRNFERLKERNLEKLEERRRAKANSRVLQAVVDGLASTVAQKCEPVVSELEAASNTFFTDAQKCEPDGRAEVRESGRAEVRDKLVFKHGIKKLGNEREAGTGVPAPACDPSHGGYRKRHGRRWLPLAEMQQAVLEETGHKVFFPPVYHGEIRRLVQEHGRDETIAATREACLAVGGTFNYRGFAAWFFKKTLDVNVAETILLARQKRAENEQKEAEEMGEGLRQLIVVQAANELRPIAENVERRKPLGGFLVHSSRIGLKVQKTKN